MDAADIPELHPRGRAERRLRARPPPAGWPRCVAGDRGSWFSQARSEPPVAAASSMEDGDRGRCW